jgi:hypothetical protein
MLEGWHDRDERGKKEGCVWEVDLSANEKKKEEKHMNKLTVASWVAFMSKAQHEEKGRPPSVCEQEGVSPVREREQSAGKKKKKSKRQTKVARALDMSSFSQEQSAKNEKEIKTNQKRKWKGEGQRWHNKGNKGQHIAWQRDKHMWEKGEQSANKQKRKR